jgi:hypothetical protein
MDRRRFIGSGTASAIGLVGTAGTAASVLPGRLPAQRLGAMPADMDDYLARLDAGTERIGRWSTVDVVPDWRGDRAEGDRIAQTALQSLFITGMIADLPIEGQMRPEVQRRIHDAIPLMDEATARTTAFLASRTAADLSYVQVGLRDYDAGARIFAAFDREAAANGLSEWRRAQTREIFAQAEWRLRNQPPELIVGEYIDKVEKLGAADIPGESQLRTLAAQAGEKAFWEQSGEKTLHQARISRGLKVMGFGLLIFAGGALIAAAGAVPGVFVATVGAVTLIVGLIILLVGAFTPDRPR